MPSTGTASPQMATMSSPALPGTDVPDEFDQMWRFAEALAEADDFLPQRLRKKPGNVLALMLRARALNIPLAVAWDELYVTKGKVGQTAKLVRALARRAGHRIAYVEADAFHAVALIQCAGETTPHRVSFTIQEARALGLTEQGKGEDGAKLNQYDRQPKNMLVARVTTRAVNWHCPEVLLGLGNEYLTDEVDEPLEFDSDVITALQEEHREKVAGVLRVAEELEKEPDGGDRLAALRELFISAREAEALDFAADGTGEYSVRQVLTEKMKAADQLAKQQEADPEYSKELADAQRAAEEAEAAPEGEGKKAAKQAAKKTAKNAPTKKAAAGPQKDTEDASTEDKDTGAAARRPARKAAAKKPQKDAPASSHPGGKSVGRAATHPGGREAGKEAEARPDGRTLPCGCVVDDVIETGKHSQACKG